MGALRCLHPTSAVLCRESPAGGASAEDRQARGKVKAGREFGPKLAQVSLTLYMNAHPLCWPGWEQILCDVNVYVR